MQTWIVPPCVTSIQVTMAGADGGGTNGGNGAVVNGTIAVTPGQTLNIYVGGSGNCPGAGWNGGGAGQNANNVANRSCGGGGASDIRIGGTGLGNRVIVAAGGGGQGGGTQDAIGGAGGCATGTAGTSPFGQGGGGGSQAAGGSAGPPWIASGNSGTSGGLGTGGNGGTDPCYNNSPGGGGGGGYYGGGGGGSDCFDLSPYGGGSGGGGSSLYPGAGGCTAGSNNGAGYVSITYTIGTAVALPTNTGPYCVGQTIQLNAGGTGTAYAWTGPNGFSSTAQNPTVPATALAAGNYTVTITNAGCTATGSTTVAVNPAPIVNAGGDQVVCAGTQVTLIGTGATTYVWNNGVTQGVAFTPPAGTTTYTVTGTSAGCTATDQVNVTVNPAPNVNAGIDQVVCAGSQVTLTATGATSYAWNNGVTQGVAFTPPAGTTTYTVTGTSLGCTATDQVNVTVNSSPPVNAGSDQIVCAGTQVTLTATGAVTYAWNNGVSQGVTFTPPAGTTTYTVTGTTSGCTATDQVNVTVNPAPIVNAGADQTVCAGTQVTLTGSGATSYAWNYGVTQGVAFTPPAGTTTYTVTGTSLGCTGTDQVNVTVNPIPAVNAGLDQTVCQGTQVILTGTGATTYAWNNGVSQGVAFTPPLGTTVYTVTGTSNACSATDQVSVTVTAFPQVNAGGDQTVCAGTPVTLTATNGQNYTWNNGVVQSQAFTPAVGTVIYTVTSTSGACSSNDQVSVTVNAIPVVNAGADQVVCEAVPITLTASGASGYSWDNSVTQGVPFNQPVGTVNYTVTATVLGCSSTDQVSVTVNPLPIVDAGPDDVVCFGGSTTLTASGATSYLWAPGGANTASVNVTPNQTTVYQVTGTVSGCSATDQVTVTVSGNATISAGPDVAICFGESIDLTAAGGVQYLWAPGGQQTATITVSPGTTTNYSLQGVDAYGCIGSDDVLVTVNPLPIVDAGPNQTICLGESIAMTATGQGTLIWSGGLPNGTVISPQQGGWYHITATTVDNCVSIDSVFIGIENATPAAFSMDITSGCAPLTVEFTNTTPGGSSDCIWQMDGASLNNCGPVSYTFTNSGYYDVTFITTSANGCESSISMSNAIYVAPQPVAAFSFTPNPLSELNAHADFINLSQNATSWIWNFGDGSSATMEHPMHDYPLIPGSYNVQLIAISSYGCADTVVLPLVVAEELIYYIPNSFTPDGDFYNQDFKPMFSSGFDPMDYHLMIFNRWGEVLFESFDALYGWDGTYNGELVAQGTYTWTIDFKVSATDERKQVLGHVNLLR